MSDKYDMKENKTYKIELEDCCIVGKIIGRFKRYEHAPVEDDEEIEMEYSDAVFDIGAIGPLWGAWTVEEVPEGTMIVVQ